MPYNYLSVLYKHNSSGNKKCGVKSVCVCVCVCGGGAQTYNAPNKKAPPRFLRQ